jgi:hypothetical protein
MFGDIGKMMQLAGRLKKELPAMKEKLAEAQYTAEAGGGAVAATVNGRLQISDLSVDPALMAEADAEMLADLVKAAVAAAQARATEAASEAMKELTGGMTLPGMDDLI